MLNPAGNIQYNYKSHHFEAVRCRTLMSALADVTMVIVVIGLTMRLHYATCMTEVDVPDASKLNHQFPTNKP